MSGMLATITLFPLLASPMPRCAILFPILATLFLAGCGIKGPLTLPPPPPSSESPTR